MKISSCLLLLFVALTGAALAGVVEEKLPLQQAPGAVVAVFDLDARPVHVRDIVKVTRDGRSLGEAVVLGVRENRAVLAPRGSLVVQPGDAVAVVRSVPVPPHEEMPSEPPWNPAPEVRVDASHEERAVNSPEMRTSIGFPALWEEWLGTAEVRNQGSRVLRDVVVDVYVNRGWISRHRLGDLAPGKGSPLKWTHLGSRLQNVMGAAEPVATVVVRWKADGREELLRARSRAR